MAEPSGNGYLARPAGAKGLPVVVLPSWWGLNPFFRSICDRLAEAGFVAYAPDLYRSAATTVADATRLRDQLDREATQREALAAVNHVRSLGAPGASVGVLGFSLGARFTLGLLDAPHDAVGTVVVFYGSGAEHVRQTSAAVQGHFAGVDPWGPSAKDVEALERRIEIAGGITDFHVYPSTGHWFFERDQPHAFDGEAAGLAWRHTVAFLTAHLTPPSKATLPPPADHVV